MRNGRELAHKNGLLLWGGGQDMVMRAVISSKHHVDIHNWICGIAWTSNVEKLSNF